jgi:hypothetical protein
MEDDGRRPRRKATWIGAFTALALMLYPLSLGPALWMCRQGYLSIETLNVVYFPLRWLKELFPIVKGVVEWYEELWI